MSVSVKYAVLQSNMTSEERILGMSLRSNFIGGASVRCTLFSSRVLLCAGNVWRFFDSQSDQAEGPKWAILESEGFVVCRKHMEVWRFSV